MFPLDLPIFYKVIPNFAHILGSYIIASSKIKKVTLINTFLGSLFIYFPLSNNMECLVEIF